MRVAVWSPPGGAVSASNSVQMADPLHLVERRRRYIQRQIELNARTVNVRFRDARPEGTGPPNRHGMPQLPVGQHVVKNWPVLDLGEQPDVPLDTWRLEVGGLVDNPDHADVGSIPGAAAGRRRERLPLRHDVEPLRQPLGRRAIQDDRRAGRAERGRAVRAVHRLRLASRARRLPTPPTCRSHARWKTMCCSCTRGKDGRSRASTAGRAA